MFLDRIWPQGSLFGIELYILPVRSAPAMVSLADGKIAVVGPMEWKWMARTDTAMTAPARPSVSL